MIIFDEITRKSYSRDPVKVVKEAKNRPAQRVETMGGLVAKPSSSENQQVDDEDDGGPQVPVEDSKQSLDVKQPHEQNSRKTSDQNDGGVAEPELPTPVDEMDQSSNQIVASKPDPTDTAIKETEATETVEFKPNPKEYLNMKPLNYYIVTIVTYMFVWILSITVSKIDFFFGIEGATTGSFVTFLGPGSFYIISL